MTVSSTQLWACDRYIQATPNHNQTPARARPNTMKNMMVIIRHQALYARGFIVHYTLSHAFQNVYLRSLKCPRIAQLLTCAHAHTVISACMCTHSRSPPSGEQSIGLTRYTASTMRPRCNAINVYSLNEFCIEPSVPEMDWAYANKLCHHVRVQQQLRPIPHLSMPFPNSPD